MEIKNCQKCNQDFAIQAEDFEFYEKRGVLPPKHCPSCRAQWRLLFRNERVFYKRPCDKCKTDVISTYSPNKKYTVWCRECWLKDDWDSTSYGKDYDPKRPFFEQVDELFRTVPKVALAHVRSVNSEYSNIAADNKDCYMIVESSNNENCYYGYWLQLSRDSIDTSFAHQAELCYESDDIEKGYRLFYSKGCSDSRDSYFLFNSRGCSNCIGSINLRNKQYYIFNEPVGKEAYEKFVAEARLDTHEGIETLRKKATEFILTQPHKYAEISNAPGSSGNYISNTRDCRKCFHAFEAENCAYSNHVWRGAKDCMDCDTSGRTAERNYNCINTALEASDCVGCQLCWGSSRMLYSFDCGGSNDCIGSSGLKTKSYCILNKQYTKDEYEELRQEIIERLKKEGTYGEFFPTPLSSFGYNETAAQDVYPLDKETALSLGHTWEDHPRGTFGKETQKWDTVPQSIHDTTFPDISKEIFACIECSKNYRIVPREFEFYKNLSIPLPRMCPDCRHTRRLKARGPNVLWKRTCQCSNSNHEHKESCKNEFDTSYAPERPELVYCESCYQAEVA